MPDFPSPGVLFKDITPLLADGPCFTAVIEEILAVNGEFDLVAGVEARGFLLAGAVAYAGGSGLVPVRKAGKLPGRTRSVAYGLEYGTAVVEVHEDAVAPGQQVLIVDDVLATGGTLAATVGLFAQLGATVSGVSVLVELNALGGRSRVPTDVHAVLTI